MPRTAGLTPIGAFAILRQSELAGCYQHLTSS